MTLELDELRLPGRFIVKCINRACGLVGRFEAQRGKIQIRVAGESTAPWQEVIFVSVPTHDGRRTNEIPYAPDWFQIVESKPAGRLRKALEATADHTAEIGNRKPKSDSRKAAASSRAPSTRGRQTKRKSKKR